MKNKKNPFSNLSHPIKKISVIGGSQCNPDIYDIAYQVGKEIAINKALLVCGGLGGVMEAVCRGAKEAGGITMGILPGEEDSSSNKYVDIKIPTGLGYARNILVVKTGHAIIAIDGSYGTLSEIAYSLTFNKPIIGLNTWNLEKCCDSSGKTLQIINAKSPKQAVDIALAKSAGILKT